MTIQEILETANHAANVQMWKNPHKTYWDCLAYAIAGMFYDSMTPGYYRIGSHIQYLRTLENPMQELCKYLSRLIK